MSAPNTDPVIRITDTTTVRGRAFLTQWVGAQDAAQILASGPRFVAGLITPEARDRSACALAADREEMVEAVLHWVRFINARYGAAVSDGCRGCYISFDTKHLEPPDLAAVNTALDRLLQDAATSGSA